MVEAWLRGPIEGVNPLVAPLIMSLEMAKEDVTRATSDLSTDEIWRHIPGLPTLGFQLRHIAGSVDRLGTYLRGEALTEEQLAVLQKEKEPGDEDAASLLANIDESFKRCEAMLRALDPATLTEKRVVGRRQLPTTGIGLVVHIAEHTQRHVGQTVAISNLLRAQSGKPRPKS
ncbi:MAG: DinB family protein [Bryobacterales bacterium]|nr:DinB family protein [Bryobacterales bacterium]